MNILLIGMAVIPAVLLMIAVYKKDRIEKEPVGLLIGLMALGALSCLPASILENLLSPRSLNGTLQAFLFYVIVVGGSEELCKYVMMRIRTWRSREFNCSFDGIVYAVFTSLGFAALENVMYVSNYGVGNAVVRAFTAVPGHACFGLIMGYYYGSARKYANLNSPTKAKSENFKAVVIPALIHVIYDFTTELGFLFFLAVLAGIYVYGTKLLKKSSLTDSFIYGGRRPAVTTVGTAAVFPAAPTVSAPSHVPAESSAPPISPERWICPGCGTAVSGKFCSECGMARPAPSPGSDAPGSPWRCTVCGSVNRGNFCADCGAKKPIPKFAPGQAADILAEDRFVN